jgi:hypothetical protein
MQKIELTNGFASPVKWYPIMINGFLFCLQPQPERIIVVPSSSLGCLYLGTVCKFTGGC